MFKKKFVRKHALPCLAFPSPFCATTDHKKPRGWSWQKTQCLESKALIENLGRMGKWAYKVYGIIIPHQKTMTEQLSGGPAFGGKIFPETTNLHKLQVKLHTWKIREMSKLQQQKIHLPSCEQPWMPWASACEHHQYRKERSLHSRPSLLHLQQIRNEPSRNRIPSQQQIGDVVTVEPRARAKMEYDTSSG